MNLPQLFPKIYKTFLFASLAVGSMILFSMPFLYVHFSYGTIYVTCFVLGILLANIGVFLFQWREFPVIWLTVILHFFLLVSIFLFPFSHKVYAVAPQIRWVLLVMIFILGALSFFLYRTLQSSDTKNFFIIPSIFSLLALCLSFLFQIYATNPAWEIYLLLCLVMLTWIFVGQNRWVAVIGLVFGISSITGAFFFEKGGGFYLSSGSERYETQAFDMDGQINIYAEKQAIKQDFDIADTYTGRLDTYKNIYLNGRYYGKLVENESRKEYASQTPLGILFALQDTPQVLILNSSGGGDVSLTHLLANGEIDALEANQNILDQIRDRESLYVGGIYHNRNTLFYHSSVRPYAATTNKKYDTVLLNYDVMESRDLFFLQEREPQFSVSAIRDYLRILNPQGILFFHTRTFSPIFTKAIMLTFLATLEQAVPLSPKEWSKHLYLFETPYGLNVIFTKTILSPEKMELYKSDIAKLQYHDVLNEPESEFGKDVEALFTQDKNRQHHIPFSVKPVQDNGSQWFFSIQRDLSLFSNNSWDFSIPTTQKIFLGVLLFCICLFLLFREQFKKQQLHNMGLGLFFSYLFIAGVIFGLDFVFGLGLFHIFQTNSFFSGKVFLIAFLCAQVVGIIFFVKIPWRIYGKIQLGLASQLLVHGIVFFLFAYIFHFFLVLSLVWRILLPCVLVAILYPFSFSMPFLQLSLASCLQKGNREVLISSLLLGVLTGFCIGFPMMYYFSIASSLGIGLFLIIVIMICSIFLDRKMKGIDYNYSKDKI